MGLGALVAEISPYDPRIGYHLGRATRVGLNYDRTRRASPIALRGYERANIGTSITYDF